MRESRGNGGSGESRGSRGSEESRGSRGSGESRESRGSRGIGGSGGIGRHYTALHPRMAHTSFSLYRIVFPI